MNASAVLAPLPPEDANVVVVPMLTISRAVDLFIGDISRKSRSEDGRTAASYRRILAKFVDHMPVDADVTEIRDDDCRRFLDRWATRKPGTQANVYKILNSFLGWLYRHQRIRRNPLDHVPRPRQLPAEDLDVVTVDTHGVRRLLAGGRTWTETLAVAIPAFIGPRRKAIARLRLRDYNRATGHLRFREKGGKTIWKPIPVELRGLLDAAIADGAIVGPDAYLVPPEGLLTRTGDRDDRVIWRVVKRVAAREGVEAHVHALRAAFAVFYLEQFDRDIVGLQELMGHESSETTRVYLRKLDKARAMEPVRALSWGIDALPQFAGNQFASSPVMGAGGFEPPSADSEGVERPSSEHPGERLDEALASKARQSASAVDKERA